MCCVHISAANREQLQRIEHNTRQQKPEMHFSLKCRRRLSISLNVGSGGVVEEGEALHYARSTLDACLPTYR